MEENKLEQLTKLQELQNTADLELRLGILESDIAKLAHQFGEFKENFASEISRLIRQDGKLAKSISNVLNTK